MSIFICFALRIAKVVGSEKNDPEGRFLVDSLLKRFDESFRLPVVVLKNVRVQPEPPQDEFKLFERARVVPVDNEYLRSLVLRRCGGRQARFRST